jgi:hypothetical protein
MEHTHLRSYHRQGNAAKRLLGDSWSSGVYGVRTGASWVCNSLPGPPRYSLQPRIRHGVGLSATELAMKSVPLVHRAPDEALPSLWNFLSFC